jgi:hypothetical protein
VKTKIESHEARTRLPGQVPSESHTRPDPAAAIDKYLAFMKANPNGTRVDIKAMPEAGRG